MLHFHLIIPFFSMFYIAKCDITRSFMGNRTNGVQFFKALMLHGRLTKEDAVKIPLIKQDPNA